MSELPRRRGRRLAASAVAFFSTDVRFIFQTTHQTCTPHSRWISSVAPNPDNIAARPQTTGRENTRRISCYLGGGGSALFVAAARGDEDGEEPRPTSAQPIDPQVHVDLADTELLPGDSASERVSGRIAEPRGPRRWNRLRSTRVARALGRVFGGRAGLAEERDMDDTLNSVVSGQRLPEDRNGDGGLLSRFLARRWQRQRPYQIRSDPDDGGLVEAAGRESRGEEARKRDQERVHESRDVVDVAAAGSVAGAVVGGAAVDVRRASAPAKYDGEEVLPETWAKVDELRARAESFSSDPSEGQEERGLRAWLASGGDGREGLTDTDLLRFIMFRHGDVDVAWRQLKHAAAWRQERRVEDVLSEDRWSRHEELQSEMFWVGKDVDDRPTMVLRSIAHHPGAIDSEDFQRYFLFLLEQGRQLWGLGSEQQLNIIVDRIGAGIKNQDPQLLRTMLPVFRDAYPDIVHRCYVAPSSWIFRFVWIIAARLVDERQRNRVLLLVGDWQSRLLEDFGPSVLPSHLGGTLSDYPPKQPPDMT